MRVTLFYILASTIFLVSACTENKAKDLPFLGRHEIVDGIEIKHKIRQFNFIDQDSVAFTSKTLKGNIYVADFFFTSCPSICPKVMKNMLRLQDRYQDSKDFKLVSFSIDPKRDTPARLKSYANNIEADLNLWSFVHGAKDDILEIANEDYYVPAYEDKDVPGGFDHSGKLLLIDKEGHLRGFAEGTEEDSVTEFFDEVDALLSSYK